MLCISVLKLIFIKFLTILFLTGYIFLNRITLYFCYFSLVFLQKLADCLFSIFNKRLFQQSLFFKVGTYFAIQHLLFYLCRFIDTSNFLFKNFCHCLFCVRSYLICRHVFWFHGCYVHSDVSRKFFISS